MRTWDGGAGTVTGDVEFDPATQSTPTGTPVTINYFAWDNAANWDSDIAYAIGDDVTFLGSGPGGNIQVTAANVQQPASMTFSGAGGATYTFLRANSGASNSNSAGYQNATQGVTADSFDSSSPFAAGATNLTLAADFDGKVILRARPTASTGSQVNLLGGTLEINDAGALPVPAGNANQPTVTLGDATLAVNVNTGRWDTKEQNTSPASSQLAGALNVTGNGTLANTAVDEQGNSRQQNQIWNQGTITISADKSLTVKTGLATTIGSTLVGLGSGATASTFTLGNSTGRLSLNTNPSRIGSTSLKFDLGSGLGVLDHSNTNGTTNLGALGGGVNTALRGSSGSGANTSSDVYSIGALGLNDSYGGKILNGVNSSSGGTAAPTASIRHTGIAKVGAGTLTLSGDNQYSGTTTVSGGTLKLGSTHALGDSASAVTVAPGGTLDLNGINQVAGKSYVLTGGSLVNDGGGPVTIGSGASGNGASTGTSFNGVFTGAGTDPTVSITGGGGGGATADALLQLTWLRANASVPGTSVGSGYTKAPIITVDPAPAGGRTAKAYATIGAPGAGTAGQVTGITIVDPGYGYTQVPGFTIGNAPGDVTGSGFNPTLAMGLSSIVFSNGGSGYTSAPTVTVNGGTTAPVAVGGFGSIAVNSTSSIGGSGNLIVEAVASGAGGLNKVGGGTVFLNAANTYTGLTDVTAGTLGGTGSIAGDLQVDAGATLAPGASIESFGVGGNADIDGTLAIEFDGTGSGSIDLLTVSGLLDIAAAVVDFDQLGAPADDAAYVFATYGTLSGPFAGALDVPAGYTINYAFGGNNVALVPIPEPAAMGLFAAAAFGLLGRRKRRVA